jgi:hypothetical protein
MATHAQASEKSAKAPRVMITYKLNSYSVERKDIRLPIAHKAKGANHKANQIALRCEALVQTGEAGHICRKLAFGESETQMLSMDDLFKRRHFDREIIILCVRPGRHRQSDPGSGHRVGKGQDRFQRFSNSGT